MSVLAGRGTRVMLQGLAGASAEAEARRMLAAGTRLVAGVAEGAGGGEFEGVPLFETVSEAVRRTGATASVVSGGASAAADFVLEAADAGVELIVCTTEGIPLLDAAGLKRRLRGSRTRLVGPGSAGVLTPGGCLLGDLAADSFAPGRVGQLGTGGALLAEAGSQLREAALGTSTAVELGRGPVRGLSAPEVLAQFRQDVETEAILLTGFIPPHEVADCARAVAACAKPVAAFLPAAGAGETAVACRRRLAASGCALISDADAIGRTLASLLER